MFLLFFFLRIRRPPRSPLFPSPTLFRPGFTALAQSSSSVLTGRVISSQSRQPLENVVVTATSPQLQGEQTVLTDRKSTRLNSSHANISYAVFCLKKKKITEAHRLLLFTP